MSYPRGYEMIILGTPTQRAESPCNLGGMTAEKWITRREAAEALGVSVTHFRRLVRRHEIRKRAKATGEMSSVRYAAADVAKVKRERAAWV